MASREQDTADLISLLVLPFWHELSYYLGQSGKNDSKESASSFPEGTAASTSQTRWFPYAVDDGILISRYY